MLKTLRWGSCAASSWRSATTAGVCAVILLVVIPAVLHHHSAQVSRDTAAAEEMLAIIETEQQALLSRVLLLQEQMSEVRQLLSEVNATLQRAKTVAVEDVVVGLGRECGLESAKHSVEDRLKELEELAKRTKAQLTAAAQTNRRHYVIKWHGPKGIRTSKSLYSEFEADSEFEHVGDFAKKLLLYDPTVGQWVVLRQYGGENWLAMLSNDGVVQNAPESR